MKTEPNKIMPTKPFETDGCSGFISFFYELITGREPKCQSCCVQHDKAYWLGGDLKLRLDADRKFRDCLLKNEHSVLARIMYFAVRLGGQWFIPFPSVRKVGGKWKLVLDGVRWGYGFQYPKYK